MYEQIRAHIASGRLGQALREASELAASLNANDFGNDLLQLEGQNATNERNRNLGTLSQDDYGRKQNSLGVALTNILADMEAQFPAPPQEQPASMHPITLQQILQWNNEHSLRPTFTQQLLKDLLVSGRSMNLTGEAGQGKKRQLEDLQKMTAQQGIYTALLDLKECRRQYGFFLEDAARQLHLPHTQLRSLKELLDALTARPQQRFLIMIHNLEVLNEPRNNDPQYNADFVNSLNFIKNMDNCLLLCSSKEWLKEVVFDGETSLLTLERTEIPALKQTDIQAELKRRLYAHEVLQQGQHVGEIRKKIQEAPKPYDTLCLLTSKLRAHYQPKTFAKDLKNWLTK